MRERHGWLSSTQKPSRASLTPTTLREALAWLLLLKSLRVPSSFKATKERVSRTEKSRKRKRKRERERERERERGGVVHTPYGSDTCKLAVLEGSRRPERKYELRWDNDGDVVK